MFIKEIHKEIKNMKDRRTATIYRIYNKKTKKSYIGSTRDDIIHRWRTHLRALRKGTHYGVEFQRDYETYGLTALGFSILEMNVFLHHQFIREQYWLKKYKKNYSCVRGVKRTYEISSVIQMLKEKYSYREIRDKLNVPLGTITNLKRKYIGF